MNDTLDENLRSQLDVLQALLAARESTPHLARAAVALVVALILAGAAAKLFHDSVRLSYLGVLAAAGAAGAALYAAVHYARARRHLADEHARFARLLALRRMLRLDDPSALLPR